MNGIQIIKKGEGYFAPKNKLTNICEEKNLRCNECDGKTSLRVVWNKDENS